MGLKVNGTPLKTLIYNGLKITSDAEALRNVNFSHWSDGYFIITDSDGVTHRYNVDFDGDENPVKIYDTNSEITITW